MLYKLLGNFRVFFFFFCKECFQCICHSSVLNMDGVYDGVISWVKRILPALS